MKDAQRAGAREEFPSVPWEEPAVSFQPYLPSVAEPEPTTPNLNGSKEEPIPLRVEERSLAETQVSLFENALMLYKQGRYTEAGKTILGKFSSEDSDARIPVLLARIYANQGELSQAVEWSEKAVAADKLNPTSHYLRAIILQEQGRLEEATASLKRTLYLDPSFVLAHFALGNLARQEGRGEESEKHFENVLSLLNAYQPQEILPESEGITAERLRQIIGVCLDQREKDES
jgi:chemotaxis protein methyltransferase CheR